MQLRDLASDLGTPAINFLTLTLKLRLLACDHGALVRDFAMLIV
jgi:hypothetical protein